MVQDTPPPPLEAVPETLEQIESDFRLYTGQNLRRWALRWLIGFGVVWAITASTGGYGWLWYLAIGVALFSLGFHLLVGRAMKKKAAHVRAQKAELDAEIVAQAEGRGEDTDPRP